MTAPETVHSLLLARAGTSIAVVRHGGIYLCHRIGKHAHGTFGCPGGMIDPGEISVQAAAARELLEETGLVRTPEELEYVFTAEHADNEKSACTHWLKTVLRTGEALKNLEPHKHEDWRWYDLQSVHKLPLMMSTPQMVERLISELVARGNH